MTSPTITCLQTRQVYEYEILDGWCPKTINQMHYEWEAEKVATLNQIFADFPAATRDMNLFTQKLNEYQLVDYGWNWLNKSVHFNTAAYHWFFLKADDKIQAACIIFHPSTSRLDGESIIYIDYLATAYWNRDRPGHNKKFNRLGRILIAHASRFAISQWGYRPGFGLHSLPTAEAYYRGLGMREFDADPNKENLRYYETPSGVAEQLAQEVS